MRYVRTSTGILWRGDFIPVPPFRDGYGKSALRFVRSVFFRSSRSLRWFALEPWCFYGPFSAPNSCNKQPNHRVAISFFFLPYCAGDDCPPCRAYEEILWVMNALPICKPKSVNKKKQDVFRHPTINKVKSRLDVISNGFWFFIFYCKKSCYLLTQILRYLPLPLFFRFPLLIGASEWVMSFFFRSICVLRFTVDCFVRCCPCNFCLIVVILVHLYLFANSRMRMHSS